MVFKQATPRQQWCGRWRHWRGFFFFFFFFFSLASVAWPAMAAIWHDNNQRRRSGVSISSSETWRNRYVVSAWRNGENIEEEELSQPAASI